VKVTCKSAEKSSGTRDSHMI